MSITSQLIEYFEEQKAMRKGLSYDEKRKGAANDFQQWREANPGFSTPAMLTAWRTIRIGWGLTREEATDPPEPVKPPKSLKRRRSDVGKGWD